MNSSDLQNRGRKPRSSHVSRLLQSIRIFFDQDKRDNQQSKDWSIVVYQIAKNLIDRREINCWSNLGVIDSDSEWRINFTNKLISIVASPGLFQSKKILTPNIRLVHIVAAAAAILLERREDWRRKWPWFAMRLTSFFSFSTRLHRVALTTRIPKLPLSLAIFRPFKVHEPAHILIDRIHCGNRKITV